MGSHKMTIKLKLRVTFEIIDVIKVASHQRAGIDEEIISPQASSIRQCLSPFCAVVQSPLAINALTLHSLTSVSSIRL